MSVLVHNNRQTNSLVADTSPGVC